MHGRVGHRIAPDQLVRPVHVHVVLVAKEAATVLLRPARVFIFLAVLHGFAPTPRRLAALDCLVLLARVALLGIAQCSNFSLNEARSFIQRDLSEVIATETVTKFENLNASIAHDLRVGWERVENKDVTVALEYAENCVRDWSEIVVLTLNPPDHGPMMLPMSFSARAKLFGLAICTALVALILAIFLDIL